MKKKEEWNRIKSNQIKSNRIESNRIESNQIKSNQIKSNQIKSNQIKSNQIKSFILFHPLRTNTQHNTSFLKNETNIHTYQANDLN
ncbi:hypothetical protein FRACYDRAFT_193268 [Fragilariopsis cylindrus CCMP1102]|uniref:Uncharacterized protein n=1 Tax=Fragilariopsis cylindrus CCMP1102 TaxID=635003 RepID=A0A1E7EY40_9STRA|nr:hypothetical protein FRACYDRAFT_193268 [Fragilariopsis cylindrus CCMP1102]|eukprot:OEU10940.1 hypothetical protein FRACYDRAFT_193268 [Fragilariopsis cylindrus CCMP1102]